MNDKRLRKLFAMKKSNFKKCWIDKELAIKLLEHNTDNRKIKDRNVKWIASQMSNGLWRDNGDTIRFRTDGVLADGQHRLLAIIMADVSVECFIVLGIVKEAMATIDTNLRRGAHDTLHMNGIKYSGKMATIIKGILKAKKGNYSKTGQRGVSTALITNELVLDFALDNLEVMEHVCRKAIKYRSEFSLLTTAFYGVNYYNLHLQDQRKADYFFELLTEGSGLNKKDLIYLFRKKLINANKDVTISNRAKFFYLYQCWSAFLTGKKLMRLPSYSSNVAIPNLSEMLKVAEAQSINTSAAATVKIKSAEFDVLQLFKTTKKK